MATDRKGQRAGGLSADEAFGTLANETRIKILQSLASADGRVAFSELRERVDVRHSGRFNYHLDELVGHFVRKTDMGYALSQTGKRVVTAVLSGAVTDDPTVERTRVGNTCQLCGAPIEVRYSEGRVEAFCTECPGMWGRDCEGEQGYLGARLLPPAGVRGRTSDRLYRVAWIWTMLKIFALSCEICPSCSAPIDMGLRVCTDHEAAGEVCPECDRRYAGQTHFRCQNCIFEMTGTIPVSLAATTEVLEFLLAHGLNPIAPDSIATVQQVFSDFDETILSIDPFRARLTFVVNDETLSLTVDNDLSVVEATTKATVETT